MTDGQLFALMTLLEDAPRAVFGNRKIYYLAGVACVAVWERVGKGERWSFSPSSGLVKLQDGKVDYADAYRFSLEALRWVYRASRMDFVAYGHAMASRTL